MPDEGSSNWQQQFPSVPYLPIDTADPMANITELEAYTGEELLAYEGYADYEEEEAEENEGDEDSPIAYSHTDAGYTCAHAGCPDTRVYKRKCDLG